MLYKLLFLKKNKKEIKSFTDSTIMIRGKVKLWELNSAHTKWIEVFFHDFYDSLTRPVVITQVFKYVCNIQLWKNFKGKLLLSGSGTKCLKNVSKGPGKNLSKRNHSMLWIGSKTFCPTAHFIKLILLK